MNPKKIFLLVFLSILFLSALIIFPNAAKAQAVSAPTIISQSSRSDTLGFSRPYFIGLIPAGAEVLVYVDGVYADLAPVNQSETTTDNFYYQYEYSLGEGAHEFKFIARDKSSLVLSAPTNVTYRVAAIPAPTLIKPSPEDIIGKAKPLVSGLTVSNSWAHIYIDGVYNGQTNTLRDDSGTANFAYQPFLNLSVGWHEVWAIAESSIGGKSRASNILRFKVEHPMPAPILFTPVVNSRTTSVRPFVVGLAKNDSLIRVFIDNKLNGQFQVENHNSGTANFAYQPFSNLSRGQHQVYATATDSRGKESKWSDIIDFRVKAPTITVAATEASAETVAKIEEAPLSEEEEPVAIISEEEGIIEKLIPETDEHLEELFGEAAELVPEGIEGLVSGKEAAAPEEIAAVGLVEEKIEAIESGEESKITDEDIKSLIEGTEKEDLSAQAEAESGLIDEDKAGQSKLNLNLIIFITFLLGVIVWIFWVNKELIKERKKQNEQNENKNNSAAKNEFNIITSKEQFKQDAASAEEDEKKQDSIFPK